MSSRRLSRNRRRSAPAGPNPFHLVPTGFQEILRSAVKETGAEASALYIRLGGTERYVLAGEWKKDGVSFSLPHGLPSGDWKVPAKGGKISPIPLEGQEESWEGLWVPLRHPRGLCGFLLLLWRGGKGVARDVLERVERVRSLWSALAFILVATAKVASEWEALRAFADHWQSLLNGFPFALLLLDASGRALLSNEPARALLQLTQKQVPGEEWASLLYRLPLEIRPAVAQAVEISLEGSSYQMVVSTRQGRHIRIHALPLGKRGKGGTAGVGGCVLILEDFTHAWEKERQLQEARRLAEIGQMTATLAHELRNPLTSIRGAAQLLREEASSSRLRQWAEIIEEEAEEMDGVLTQCLELAKPPQLDRKSLSLVSVVERILRQQSPVFQKSGIQVIWKKPAKSPRVYGDGIQLGQALRNLIRNSIQAMPEGGDLRVCVGEDSEGAFIKVQDTGMGIPKEVLGRVFTPFFTTKANGTGLGLCHVKRVVEAHGGKVSLESELGKGTLFTIHLPCVGASLRGEGCSRNGEEGKKSNLKKGGRKA
jgi:signal transduction histidine kinase